MRVAVLDDYQHVALEAADWSDLDADIEVFHEPLGDEDAVVRRLRPFEVVVVMRERTPLPATVLRRLPTLRLVVTTGAVNRSIDLGAAREQGVTVCGTESRSRAAELTWALILAATRRLLTEAGSVRAGGWQTTVGGDLEGHTLGLLGLGRLGARVAAVGQAFGMTTLAWSENLTVERAAAVGVQAVPREELFARADVLSVHLVLSDRTRGLVGPAELAAMKPTALLVNTSRGPIVDEAALVHALRTGAIGAAALDVFDEEPLPADHPLRGLDNALLTPHIGYVTADTYATFYRGVVEDIAAWSAGAPVRVLT
ncbi:D-2-hydroxyacid dehydrogenase family protein [Phycicoccus endophyticus]|uniref:D-2-hydroxyacid dehydrogenase family protein n=1 Tax=Phycicoccus endophyticus TaxID=1690220 RepID=A0A7G9QZC1_9MICO|nr:D-2-hydroxyacid dehydrogenase family protein [Phycicoccus endophyticus]NHI19050.1 D-2-hydroxyacid dehydrogenase family protein [Phycicoccus endophyticus]QNN48696.1 D-2-hydroxyacid dehydrogenase family protein [Phycicoccus endophyticus]GGL32486.1 2-hydroxyacid dehydrogenase [Phycicoccus endophyticus]